MLYILQQGSKRVLLTPQGNRGMSVRYEMDGRWHPFSPDGNDQMHQAYLAFISDTQNSRTASIVAGGVERMVDFVLMTQMHTSTKTTSQSSHGFRSATSMGKFPSRTAVTRLPSSFSVPGGYRCRGRGEGN